MWIMEWGQKKKTLKSKWCYVKGFSGYYLIFQFYSFKALVLHQKNGCTKTGDMLGFEPTGEEEMQTINCRFCSFVSLTLYNQSFVNSEEVTRDYLSHIKEPIMRECCLLPWFPEKLTDKEWVGKLSDKTTLEFVRKELSALQMKVCSFSVAEIF